MSLYQGYEFKPRTAEQVIKYNALCWGHNPVDAWEDYLDNLKDYNTYCPCGSALTASDLETDQDCCEDCR